MKRMRMASHLKTKMGNVANVDLKLCTRNAHCVTDAIRSRSSDVDGTNYRAM